MLARQASRVGNLKGPRGAFTVIDSLCLANRSVSQAPFIWISNGHVRGTALHSEVADAGDLALEWIWDGSRLLVRSDPFGLIPAFLYQRRADVAVSTSIPKLIAEGAQLSVDWPALGIFLRLGFFVGDDTPFQEVRAIPPGAQISWKEGVLEWAGTPYVVRRSDIRRNDALDRAIDLTRRSVERRLPRTAFAVPLSGGRDSRQILLSLIASGHPPDFVVTTPRWPPAAAEDEGIAAKLAAALQLRHVILNPTNAPAALEARKNVSTSYCALEHGWFFPMLDYLRDRVSLIYEGNGGALWSPGWLQQRELRALWHSGKTLQVANRIFDDYSVLTEGVLEHLLPEGMSSRPAAVERLARELDRHVDAPDPGKAFHFWNRLRRTLTLVPYHLMRQFADVRTPLVDRLLTEFLLSLDPELISPTLARNDKTFHSDAIRRAFPAFAHIPFEAEHGTPTEATAHRRALGGDTARYVLSRGKRLHLMREAYVWPRIIYSLVHPRYAERNGWFASAVLYLAQLEDALHE